MASNSNTHFRMELGELSLDQMRRTLNKSTKLLCDNLCLDNILLTLLSAEALTRNDAQKIRKADTSQEQVQTLLDILAKSPVSSYHVFMEALEKYRPDLHLLVEEKRERETSQAVTTCSTPTETGTKRSKKDTGLGSYYEQNTKQGEKNSAVVLGRKEASEMLQMTSAGLALSGINYDQNQSESFSSTQTNLDLDEIVCVKSILDLKNNVKDKLIPILHLEHKRDTVQDQINTQVKVDFEFCIQQLLKAPESSKEVHQMCFLKIALSPFHYDLKTMTFKTILTLENLHDFVSFIELHWKEYQSHKQKGIIQLEAFLIHTLLTSLDLNKTKQSSELLFTAIIKDLRQVMSSELNNVLNSFATQSPFDWDSVSRITKELAAGNMSVIEDNKKDLPGILKALGSDARQDIVDGEFLETLKILGLEKFYPSKISLLDAMTIKNEIKRPNIVDIPWIIIRKLLMVDFHARDGVWREIQSSREDETPVDEDNFDLDDFLLEFENSSDDKNEATSINTLDIMIAIFACSDNFLKQTLAHKLFVCKLAIPFLYPRDSNENYIMSLWALRTITVHSTTNLGKPIEMPVTGEPFPLVSFVRLGRPAMSKSKLINDILTEGRHATFFAQGCENSDIRRRLAEGLVECSWFDSAGREGELPYTTMFANLRGDASSLEKHIQILQDMSSVVFIIVTIQDLVSPHITIACQEILRSNAEVIILIVGDHNKEERKVLVQTIGVDLLRKTRLISSCNHKGIQKNPKDISREARKCLSKVIADYSNDKLKEHTELINKLQECAATAKEMNDCDPLATKLEECVALAPEREEHSAIVMKLHRCVVLTKERQDCVTFANKLEGCVVLAEKLDKCTTFAKKLEDCAAVAKRNGIAIDEYDDENCFKGKVLAEEVISNLKGMEIVNCKRLLLPLQGAEWIEYCDEYRNQRKMNYRVFEMHKAEQVKKNMNSLREKQTEICRKGLSPFITGFMRNLKKQCTVFYFLEWMNIFLNQICRTQLPSLRERIQTAKRKQQNVEDLEFQISEVEIQIPGASLGLENLFREIAQIYEAVVGCSNIEKHTRNLVDCLPERAAELFMKGIPLELIDGNASGVPLSWIEAVLNKLNNIIGERKLFVLSILGIQGSGKSTLLNTMFGLKFPVSAGRCTRGVYMQLIPVDDNATLPFHYILVLDTEGLRSLEVPGPMRYNRDNELVTFVIGLADVTIVNVKGEDLLETTNILQNAVCEFFKMGLVRKYKNTKTCVFVHQNVPAPDEERMMIHARQKLLDKLDTMTREVACHENKADIYNCFSQIINFDVNNHVWYFPDLWIGNPPMAPVNPYYTKKVHDVKLLLLRIAKEQKTFLTPIDLSIRIAGLWNGVLSDDFVFSFRNNLEVKAYNNIQSRYYTLEWELQEELRTWLHKAEIKLKRCDTILSLDALFESLNEQLPFVQMAKAHEIKTHLIDYFRENNLCDITAQWKEYKLIQLESAVEQQQIEANKNLLSIKKSRCFEISQIDNLSKHKVHIMKKAAELAKELKGNKISDTELQRKFDIMWVSMMRELVVKSTETERRMDLQMQKILLNRFCDKTSILDAELQRNPLDVPLEQKSLEGSITLDDVKTEYISRKRNSSDRRSMGGDIDARRQTLELTDEILQTTSSYLKDLSTQKRKFQTAHATEVIVKLKEKFDTHNERAKESNDCTFMILPQYIIKVAVHVSRHCANMFSVMQSEYNKEHGINAKLTAYKNATWSLFKNTVKEATQDVMTADLLCTHLHKVICGAVKAKIPQQCMDEVLSDFQRTKYHLIVEIMEDLACKARFTDYMAYIRNPKEFVLKWVTEYTKDKMFSRNDGSEMSRYAHMAKIHIIRIVRYVSKCVEKATNTVKGDIKMTRWIETFSKEAMDEIAIPISTLSHVCNLKVLDFNNLQTIILSQLNSIEASLSDAFAKETKDTFKWDGTPPAQQILDKIWGCPEQCPFCGEPCADTTAGHWNNSSSGRSHMCIQHRPLGVLGSKMDQNAELGDGVKVNNEQLLQENCNYSIQNRNRRFKCSDCYYKCRDRGRCSTTDTNFVFHPYIEYKTYLPEWDIAPDPTNSVSKYWMWFMTTYQRQLADWYNTELPYIPESWKSITKEDALKDLRKVCY